eukprot:4469130-Pleurochrysis_carterae.AAC.1
MRGSRSTGISNYSRDKRWHAGAATNSKLASAVASLARDRLARTTALSRARLADSGEDCGYPAEV